MAVTFPVDAVDPVRTRLPTKPLRDVARVELDADLHVRSHDLALVDVRGHNPHPLLHAFHLAFAEHRPLALSPDAVWLTIAQGFAIHVDENAEALRHRFVRHGGRKVVRVQRDPPPDSVATWTSVIDEFVDGIGNDLGPGILHLMRCSFSTTTAVERVASSITALAAFKAYFEYQVQSICGIPTITLEGTVDDWRAIRARVDVVAEYDLAWWARVLRPVLDQFVAAAAGTVDDEFWQAAYKPAQAYDGEIPKGWICAFYPWLEAPSGRRYRNTELDAGPVSSPWVFKGGVSPSRTPSGWSRVPVKMIPENIELTVFGGLAGVAQDDDGTVRAAAAWGVAKEAGAAAMLERLLASPLAKVTTPLPTKVLWLSGPWAALYDSCDGLRIADVTIRPVAKIENKRSALVFADLDDGRCLAFGHGERGAACVFIEEGKGVEDTVVVAEDAARFFALLLQRKARAPWVAHGSLYQHLSLLSQELRRALVTPGPIVDNVNRRESYRLVTGVVSPHTTEPMKRFWWACLCKTFHVKDAYDAVFTAEFNAMPERGRSDELFRRYGFPTILGPLNP